MPAVWLGCRQGGVQLPSTCSFPDDMAAVASQATIFMPYLRAFLEAVPMVTCVSDMALARRGDIHDARARVFRPILLASRSSFIANIGTFVSRGTTASSQLRDHMI